MERRFFLQKTDIQGEIITLTSDEHQHLSKVLRLRVGDKVECFYDNSNILICEILDITKNFSTLKILDEYETSANPKVNVTLFQGLPKLDKLELITQKVTEIGLTTIIPFYSSFCIAKQNDNKIERLKKIVTSACKQCGRTKLINIKASVSFKEMLNLLNNYSLVIFANENEKTLSLRQVFKENKEINLDSVALIVGSEGGFSKEEINQLTSLKNVFSVSLGQRILRTETASISLATLVLYELNEI